MRRFFVPLENISADKISITDKTKVHHIKDVLRLKAGEEAVVFDEKGNEYLAGIERISAQGISLVVKEKYTASGAKDLMRITVACAIPKQSKMDGIIDKLTQLGVDRIIPLKTERVVARLDKHKEGLRLGRWEKIALSAAEQSQRNRPCVIEPIKDIKEVLADSGGFDLKLIPTLVGERKRLRDILINSNFKNIMVLVGPEGDFSKAEIDLAKKAGFIPVSLGNLVLRVETAAVAIASFIRLYEDS